MVETNNAEERLARIERMVESLQRDSAAFKAVTAARVSAAVPAASLPVVLANRRKRPAVTNDRRRTSDIPARKAS